MSRIPKDFRDGLYFVRIKTSNWFNGIAYVYGTAPFYKIDIYDRMEGRLYIDAKEFEVKEWGPKIEEPKS